MATLISMLFEEVDDSCVTAMYEVGPHVITIRQRVVEGRKYNADKEALQEYAMAHPDEAYHPSSAHGEYDSAFPNVGLVIWQSGFVLAEFLLRTMPPGGLLGARVLDLGCGTGQLGLALALAGADVTLTDLEHIVPLTAENAGLNAAGTPIAPSIKPFMWGTDVAAAGLGGPWDYVVAADVLYEPQHYDELLDSLQALVLGPGATGPSHGADEALVEGGVCAAEGAPEDVAPTTGAEKARHQAGGAEPSPSTAAPAAAGQLKHQQPRCYICYRVRKYGEHGFEAKAAARGFGVAAVPLDQLHPDFRCGGYRLIELTADPQRSGV